MATSTLIVLGSWLWLHISSTWYSQREPEYLVEIPGALWQSVFFCNVALLKTSLFSFFSINHPSSFDNMVKLPPSPTPALLSVEDTHTVSEKARPLGFILPDLVSHCHFPLSYNVHGDEVAQASDRWLDLGCPELTPKKRKALYGLKAGELTAYCYTTCDAEHLHVVSDFMNYLFHLDNISDGMMKRDTDVLADVVMNALWYPEEYKPTHFPGKEQPDEEISAGKLARE